MSKFNIRDKLKIINTAEKTGNIKTTCKKFNISRTQFYHYKNLFEVQGLLGLGNHHHGRKRNAMVVDEVLSLILKYPLLSVDRASKKITQKQLTAMGLYKILKAYGLESKEKRHHIIEGRIKSGYLRKLSAQQKIFLTNTNPCFAYYAQVDYPAQQVSQDIISYQRKYYLHIIIDRFSHYVFAKITRTKSRQQAVELLQQAIDKFSALTLWTNTVYTSDLKLFYGHDSCPYQQLISKHKLNLHTLYTRPKFDYCIEHFLAKKGNYIKENIAELLQEKKMETFIADYNNNYPHNAYPHYGKTPQAMIDNYLQMRLLWLKSHKAFSKNPNFILPVVKIKAIQSKVNQQNRKNLDKEISMICATQNLF